MIPTDCDFPPEGAAITQPRPPNSTRIAFTSCVNYALFPEQPWWDDIAREQPDALVLLGDQIYMDYGFWGKRRLKWPRKKSAHEFREAMEARYAEQFAEPHFRALIDDMRAKSALFATWDDHDFAWNNACGNALLAIEYENEDKKRIARELFHRYLNCAPHPPEVYGAADIGPVRLILLDNRSYADDPGPDADLLGEAQWSFLEREFATTTQDYVFLCSGITLNQGTENWSRYPASLRRLSSLIQGRERVLLLAGDIHTNRFDPPGDGVPCFQAVASGLAQKDVWGHPLHNWGLADVGSDGVTITLVEIGKRCRYRIPRTGW